MVVLLRVWPSRSNFSQPTTVYCSFNSIIISKGEPLTTKQNTKPKIYFKNNFNFFNLLIAGYYKCTSHTCTILIKEKNTNTIIPKKKLKNKRLALIQKRKAVFCTRSYELYRRKVQQFHVIIDLINLP